ncbi:MAG TPA: TonB-dependent receptor, partial [Rhizomicrobium sp.]
AYLIWEHFSESDDRLRSGKQLCKKDPGPDSLGGVSIAKDEGGTFGVTAYTSQGCLPTSLYSADAFQTPNGFALPYYGPIGNLGAPVFQDRDPYASHSQSPNLRIIESQFEPDYKVKNDTVQFNVDYNITPALTFTSQTGFNNDFLWSIEDYNRFNTAPNAFDKTVADSRRIGLLSSDGVFCDPQLGCSDRLLAEDLVTSQSWQLSQEFRLASHFGGPFNFSVGGNYLHYETMEKYYVFINSLGAFAAGSGGTLEIPYVPGVTDNMSCINGNDAGRQYADPTHSASAQGCQYMDPNPIGSLNDKGHNYFLSKNPYTVNSYALFGETYYDITSQLKLTSGLRWTDDQKHFVLIPSELVAGDSWGYPILGVVDQSWGEFTGRAAVNWTPKLNFTEQTLIYGSYAHGYKAGGANPPQPIVVTGGSTLESSLVESFTHPKTFKPEFIDAFELGTKNLLLDGAITFNASAFYYNYENYQISEIVDRTALNQNFDAHIKGGEVEAIWEPVSGLRFNFSGGYEDARLAQGSRAIDLMDRTAGHAGWFVAKPFPTNSSNCIFPEDIVPAYATQDGYLGHLFYGGDGGGACLNAYKLGRDPVTNQPYTPLDPAVYGGYTGFNPASAPNNGEGFDKDVGGNELPNAPPWTASFGAQYSMPLSSDWAGTLRSDFYWQSNSYWRVFNDMSYDQLHGYTNLNLTLILTNQSGWQVMLYDKNVFNTTAITGAFLNSDDSGLTTNVFLTDPKLIGIRVTKNW